MLESKLRRTPHHTEERSHRRKRRRRALAVAGSLLAVVLIVLLFWALLNRDPDESADTRRRPRADTSTTTTTVSTTTVPLFVEPLLDEGFRIPPVGAALADQRSCTGRAVLAAVGQARFVAAGATWEEVAAAPNLAALGIHADERMLAELARGLGNCRTIAIVAEAHIRGFGIPIADPPVTCVGNATFDQPNSDRAVAELVAGTTNEPYATAMSAGLLTCPQTMVDLVVNAVEQQVGSVSAEQRACAARETNARGERFARAIAALSEDRIQVVYEIANACQ